MNIKGIAEIMLDWEQERDVLVSILKKDYVSLRKDTIELRNNFSNLEDFEKQDYLYNVQTLKAIETVLEHYTPYFEHKEWMSNNHPVLIEEQ